MEDKYDAAIAWLREKDRMKGSYYEEVACLMEELSVVSTASLQTAEADRRQVNPPLIVIPGVGGEQWKLGASPASRARTRA